MECFQTVNSAAGMSSCCGVIVRVDSCLFQPDAWDQFWWGTSIRHKTLFPASPGTVNELQAFASRPLENFGEAYAMRLLGVIFSP